VVQEAGVRAERIKEILSQRQFEKIAALKSHRQVLEKNVARTSTLIETIDKTSALERNKEDEK